MEVELSDEYLDSVGDSAGEGRVEEDCGTEGSTEEHREAPFVGGSQEGSRTHRRRDPDAHVRDGTGICRGELAADSVRDEVCRCCESEDLRRRECSGERVHVANSTSEEHLEESAPEVALDGDSFATSGPLEAEAEKWGPEMPSDNGWLPTISEVSEAYHQQDCFDVLDSDHGAQPDGPEGRHGRGIAKGNFAPQCRPAPAIPQPPSEGRNGPADARDRLAHVRLGLPAMMLQYDPGDVISQITSCYQPDVAIKCASGVLDPVPEGLAGRVRLDHLHPHPCSPLGTAIRVLQMPQEFVLAAPSTRFVASAKTHLHHADTVISAGLATVKKRASPDVGYAKFFTVVKKVNESGVPVLRTILDCRSANEAFGDPLPVNLATLPQPF
eukprot:PhM_4_TR15644/c2_g1_i4/m.6821